MKRNSGRLLAAVLVGMGLMGAVVLLATAGNAARAAGPEMRVPARVGLSGQIADPRDNLVSHQQTGVDRGELGYQVSPTFTKVISGSIVTDAASSSGACWGGL